MARNCSPKKSPRYTAGETLLTHREQPSWNIHARQTRTSRPGMVVDRAGKLWPGERRYVDVDDDEEGDDQLDDDNE